MDTREARYADAISSEWWTGLGDYRERAARAVMAVADEEHADLRAKVARLQDLYSRAIALADARGRVGVREYIWCAICEQKTVDRTGDICPGCTGTIDAAMARP